MLVDDLELSINYLCVDLRVGVRSGICKVYLIVIIVKFYLERQAIEIPSTTFHGLLL